MVLDDLISLWETLTRASKGNIAVSHDVAEKTLAMLHRLEKVRDSLEELTHVVEGTK
jgi:hypothetical protein